MTHLLRRSKFLLITSAKYIYLCIILNDLYLFAQIPKIYLRSSKSGLYYFILESNFNCIL